MSSYPKYVYIGSVIPFKYKQLTFFLCVSVLPGVEVHELLPLLLPHLFLQSPLVGCLTVGTGLGTLVPSCDFHPALFILLLLLSHPPLLLHFL